MPWMVVENEEGDHLHVVPVCIGGQIVSPHYFSYQCSCKPLMEEVGDCLLVTHNDMIGNADAKNIH